MVEITLNFVVAAPNKVYRVCKTLRMKNMKYPFPFLQLYFLAVFIYTLAPLARRQTQRRVRHKTGSSLRYLRSFAPLSSSFLQLPHSANIPPAPLRSARPKALPLQTPIPPTIPQAPLRSGGGRRCWAIYWGHQYDVTYRLTKPTHTNLDATRVSSSAQWAVSVGLENSI